MKNIEAIAMILLGIGMVGLAMSHTSTHMKLDAIQEELALLTRNYKVNGKISCVYKENKSRQEILDCTRELPDQLKAIQK